MEYIKNLYIDEGMSIRQIAEKLNKTRGFVDKYLRDNNIPKRTKSESLAIRCKNSPRDKSTYYTGSRGPKKEKQTHILTTDNWVIRPANLRADRKGIMCLFIDGQKIPQTDSVLFICDVSGEDVTKTVGNFVRNPALKSRDVCIGEGNKGKVITRRQREQISENNSGERITNYFNFTCPVCEETFSYRDTQRNRTKKYCSKECQWIVWAAAPVNLTCENKLELAFRSEIERQGYVVEIQKQFGYYPVDCYLPEIDVILQIDGTYWHAKPELYSEDELDKHQKRHRICDARFASYCDKNHLKYARVWQDDFYANPEFEIKKAIKKALKK